MREYKQLTEEDRIWIFVRIPAIIPFFTARIYFKVMEMRTRPWTMLLMMMAKWLNRHQQDVIEYLREENKILREKLGTERVILNDNQQMRLPGVL